MFFKKYLLTVYYFEFRTKAQIEKEFRTKKKKKPTRTKYFFLS